MPDLEDKVPNKEYKCKNKFCYVYNVLQSLPPDREPDCHNCNPPMKEAI